MLSKILQKRRQIDAWEFDELGQTMRLAFKIYSRQTDEVQAMGSGYSFSGNQFVL